jgi:hypothetical protein
MNPLAKAIAILLVFLGLLVAGSATYLALSQTTESLPSVTVVAAADEATTEQVHQLCAACHAYPPPESFPRSAWRREVKQGFDFFRDSTMQIDFPSLESVVRYYESRAPEALPTPFLKRSDEPMPVRFHARGVQARKDNPLPAISNVNLVHLSDPVKLDLLACDMRSDQVMVLKPYEAKPAWQVLGHVPAPAHAEVVDLDGDGIPDILVACLGHFFPTNGLVGSVVWLRGKGDGTYTPITLLEGVGRVADVQAADFQGHGKLDLVVAAFGWRTTGETIYLENQTTDWSRPKFVPRVLDNRAGAIHVPVCDLNKDGKPDFVALISQEHETIVAFINEGEGKFRKETIYTAPHPAYGSSGIQIVDLDGDGNLDVLYTNGDVLDHYMLRPEHSIQWLRNRGTFPFEHHHLASMYGVERAVAADFTGQGHQDIVAVSYLPISGFPDREEKQFDAVLYLEQKSPGEFVAHSLDKGACDHFTCAAGDIRGDGHISFVTGNHYLSQHPYLPDAVTIWENTGRSEAIKPQKK